MAAQVTRIRSLRQARVAMHFLSVETNAARLAGKWNMADVESHYASCDEFSRAAHKADAALRGELLDALTTAINCAYYAIEAN